MNKKVAISIIAVVMIGVSIPMIPFAKFLGVNSSNQDCDDEIKHLQELSDEVFVAHYSYRWFKDDTEIKWKAKAKMKNSQFTVNVEDSSMCVAVQKASKKLERYKTYVEE